MVDAGAIAGMGHVLFLVFNAVSAFRYGYNRLIRLEAELLLVLSGTDRFGRAVEMVGARVGHPGVAIVVAGERGACAHAMERMAASIGDVEALPFPTREGARRAAKALGLSAGELRSMGEDVEALLYSVIERGALIYC